MRDPLVQRLIEGDLDATDICSISNLRRLDATGAHELWNELDRGTAVLGTVAHLQQYLYSYAPMISDAWRFALTNLLSNTPRSPSRIIDWGCGQGLGLVALAEKFGLHYFRELREVTLIDASSVALNRAGAIARCLAPQAQAVERKVNFAAVDDYSFCLQTHLPHAQTLHLFSWSLDIETVSPAMILQSALAQPGDHSVWAVSHDRSFDGGSKNFEKALDYLRNMVTFGAFPHCPVQVRSQTISRSNGGKQLDIITLDGHLRRSAGNYGARL